MTRLPDYQQIIWSDIALKVYGIVIRLQMPPGYTLITLGAQQERTSLLIIVGEVTQ
jgi:hypothetical protein